MSSTEPLPPLPADSAASANERATSERGALARVFGAALGLFLAVGATYAVPALHSLRPWVPGGGYVPFWNLVGREWLGDRELDDSALPSLGAKTSRSPSAPASSPAARRHEPPPAVAAFPRYAPETTLDPPKHRLEWPEAIDPFFRRLTLADLGLEAAIARAGHWGDSIIGIDGITSGIRRRLQARFGDAGHGFHMLDRYNPSYRQQGVEFEPQGGWYRCLIVQECKKRDRHYGYGGLIVNSGGGGQSTWKTTKSGFGDSVSRFELWFAKQANGGNVEIVVDGERTVSVSTRGEPLEDGWHEIRVPSGPHSFRVRAAGGGDVRAYGVVLEDDGPGVVWDGMALIGGSSRGLRTQDPEHIASQIRHRDLDLLVFQFGGNDLERNYVDLKESMQPYYDEYGEVIRKYRAGKKALGCLIVGVGDHGKRTPSGDIVSRSFVPVLSNAQREVARQNGCAFFDLFNAMGGDGAVARWWRARPRLISPDLGHPNPFGHEVIAELITDAVLFDYERYRARMLGKPLPELAAAQTVDEKADAGATP